MKKIMIFGYVFFAVFLLCMYGNVYAVYEKGDYEESDIKASCVYNYNGVSTDKELIYVLELYNDNNMVFYQYQPGLNDLVSQTKLTVENWDNNSTVGISGKTIFSLTGCPRYVVSDRGFISSEKYYFLNDEHLESAIEALDGLWDGTPSTLYLIEANDDKEHSELVPVDPSNIKYSCNYGQYTLNFDESGNYVNYTQEISASIIYYKIDGSINQYDPEYRKVIQDGKCQPTYTVCKTSPGLTTCTIYFDELSASKEDSNFETYKCENDDKSICDPNTESTYCPTYDVLKDNIKDFYKTYKDNKNSNKAIASNALSNANRKIEQLKNLCNSIYKTSNYNSSCSNKCLSLSNDILTLKKDANLAGNSEGVSSKCGFSGNLIAWVLKILRWIRYGVPTLVIILGGIDFTKAIASDNDDELKKSGGRFVKRLIAATLIFLVPFLLEFILSVFGYDANGFCV